MDDITHYTRQLCRTSGAPRLQLISNISTFSRLFKRNVPISYQDTNMVHWTRQ